MFQPSRLQNLIDEIKRANPDDYLRLISDVTQLSLNEETRIGNFQVHGKLLRGFSQSETIIVSDVHGDLRSLLHILKKTQIVNKAARGEKVLSIFLGDYGDRGLQSSEVYYGILKLKQLFPQNIILLRGNHEGPEDLRAYPHDLPHQLQLKFGAKGRLIYNELCQLFKYFYTAIVINTRYILLHGGAPSEVSTVTDIAYAHKTHPKDRHFEEILWNDPVEGLRRTLPSPRGAGRLFGEEITDRLLDLFDVKVLIRGHEPSPQGFKINHNGKVVTLFSRKGAPYNNSYGAYMHVDMNQEYTGLNQLTKTIHRF